MWLLNIVYVVFAVLLLFGAAVFVHEYGHYWMSLRRGLKVEGFSIGFGPKIMSWMHDGVEWSWRWIPAGGFVKLPQMVTSDAIEGKPADGAEQLPPVSAWSKILVAVCGPMMNVAFGIAMKRQKNEALGLPGLADGFQSLVDFKAPGHEDEHIAFAARGDVMAEGVRRLLPGGSFINVIGLGRIADFDRECSAFGFED